MHSETEAHKDDISNSHWLWLHLSSQAIYFVLFRFATFPNIVMALHDKANFLHSISIRNNHFKQDSVSLFTVLVFYECISGDLNLSSIYSLK
jgi:mediator of RNA polymerase II transcription subunit 23